MIELTRWVAFYSFVFLGAGFIFGFALARTLRWYRRRRPRTLAVIVRLRTGDDLDLVAHYDGVDPVDGLHTYLVNLTAELGEGVDIDGFMLPEMPPYTKVGLARIVPEGDD